MMDNNQLVQIIIPIYNTGHLIERCIRSCLNQTYSNVRVICIDDGSIDSSLCVLKKLKMEFGTKLNYYHQNNKGVSSARNLGLIKSSNDGYILFVDSDDYIGPRYIELFINAIGDSDVCVCADSDVKCDIESILMSQLRHKSSVGPYKRLIKACLARSIRFDESLFVGEDYDYNFQVFIKAQKITTLDWNNIEIPYYSGHEDNNYSLMKTISQKSVFDNYYKWIKVYNLTKNLAFKKDYYKLLNDTIAVPFLTMYSVYNFTYKLDIYKIQIQFVRKKKIVQNYHPLSSKEKAKKYLYLYFRPIFRLIYCKTRKQIE